MGLAFGLAGCGTARPPQFVIAPSYSYVQADRAMGAARSEATDVTAGRIAIAKLPPMPQAPGFASLVFGKVTEPID